MNNQSSKSNKIHVRRCHVCSHINENVEALVDRCESCHKALAPFVFCELSNELEAIQISKKVYSDKDPGYKAIYPPLIGLTLYW